MSQYTGKKDRHLPPFQGEEWKKLSPEERRAGSVFKMQVYFTDGNSMPLYSHDNGATKQEQAAGIFRADYKKAYHRFQYLITKGKFKGKTKTAIIYALDAAGPGNDVEVAKYIDGQLVHQLKIIFEHNAQGGCDEYTIYEPKPDQAAPITVIPEYIEYKVKK